MSVVWPASLPQKMESSGYQESPPDNTVRHDPDGGASLVRKRYTKSVRPLSGTYRMTGAQLTILDTFYDLYGGFTEISMPHPRTGTAITARLVKPPVYAPSRVGGDNWDVTVEFEVLV